VAAVAHIDRRAGIVNAAVVLRDDRGQALPFDPARWHGAPSPDEHRFLASLAGPALDVGCGPGRVLEALARRRVAVLGVDPSPAAVALVRQKGCAVLQRSVFDPLPGTGRWETVVLLDGNIGIGGDPRRLLRRCAQLMNPDGMIVVEADRSTAEWRRCRARLERGTEAGAWFPWAVVGRGALAALAFGASLEVRQSWDVEGRWIVGLRNVAMGARACA
jgi:SAM-dependent methyltransferase